MKPTILIAALLCSWSGNGQTNAPDAFEKLKALAVDRDADVPGLGKLSASIRVVSNGKAIEETTGTPAENDLLYTTTAPN